MDDLALMQLFVRTTKAWRHAATEVLNRHGVALGQNLLLEQLWRDDGLTPGDLAGRLGISGPTAVRMAQRMEDSGLVARRRDDPDGRLVRVYLTERGRALQGPLEADLQRLHAQALDGISEADRAAFAAALQAFLTNVEGPGVMQAG